MINATGILNGRRRAAGGGRGACAYVYRSPRVFRGAIERRVAISFRRLYDRADARIVFIIARRSCRIRDRIGYRAVDTARSPLSPRNRHFNWPFLTDDFNGRPRRRTASIYFRFRPRSSDYRPRPVLPRHPAALCRPPFRGRQFRKNTLPPLAAD